MSKKKTRRNKHHIEAAHEVYIWVEELMLKALEENASVGGIVEVPYSIVSGTKKHDYPGVNLKIMIKIGWNGAIDGIDKADDAKIN